jgi:hypothetical protein
VGSRRFSRSAIRLVSRWNSRYTESWSPSTISSRCAIRASRASAWSGSRLGCAPGPDGVPAAEARRICLIRETSPSRSRMLIASRSVLAGAGAAGTCCVRRRSSCG